MLPTPDTSHVPYNRVYEPAEDSFLLLDTLSCPKEIAFLQSRFSRSTGTALLQSPSPISDSPSSANPAPSPPPLILEVGTGSGVVLAFMTAQSGVLFGPSTVPLALGVDVNRFACAATASTVRKAVASSSTPPGLFLDALRSDLVAPLRPGQVDVLVFNPPYVPTDTLPAPPSDVGRETATTTFEEESRLLELAYAGGRDGMETTDRLIEALPETLSARGCAYLLLCARNRPQEVKDRICRLGPAWRAETVGTSGAKAGWERLQIVRIWRLDSDQ